MNCLEIIFWGSGRDMPANARHLSDGRLKIWQSCIVEESCKLDLVRGNEPRFGTWWQRAMYCSPYGRSSGPVIRIIPTVRNVDQQLLKGPHVQALIDAESSLRCDYRLELNVPKGPELACV